ncbi:MAG: hypothetical protein ABIW03_05070 [Sphingomicrobium sp.]
MLERRSVERGLFEGDRLGLFQDFSLPGFPGGSLFRRFYCDRFRFGQHLGLGSENFLVHGSRDFRLLRLCDGGLRHVDKRAPRKKAERPIDCEQSDDRR